MNNEFDQSLFYELNKDTLKPCPLCGDPMVLALDIGNCLWCEINKPESPRCENE